MAEAGKGQGGTEGEVEPFVVGRGAAFGIGGAIADPEESLEYSGEEGDGGATRAIEAAPTARRPAAAEGAGDGPERVGDRILGAVEG